MIQQCGLVRWLLLDYASSDCDAGCARLLIAVTTRIEQCGLEIRHSFLDGYFSNASKEYDTRQSINYSGYEDEQWILTWNATIDVLSAISQRLSSSRSVLFWSSWFRSWLSVQRKHFPSIENFNHIGRSRTPVHCAVLRWIPSASGESHSRGQVGGKTGKLFV